MEPAVIAAASGLIGSVVGAASSVVTTWLTQQGQFRAQWRTQEAAKREALYVEFIAEASKRFADALAHQAKGPEVVVGLFAAVGRMRLMSSRHVIRAAEDLVRRIVETYASPNLTLGELREEFARGDSPDPLEAFGEPAGRSWKRCETDRCRNAIALARRARSRRRAADVGNAVHSSPTRRSRIASCRYGTVFSLSLDPSRISKPGLPRSGSKGEAARTPRATGSAIKRPSTPLRVGVAVLETCRSFI